MSTPIIFRDVDFHQYTIDPDCTIYKNNTIVPMEDIIYHSTNGYDYVLLETLSGDKRLFRLEFIVVSSFNPGIQNKWEHFKVNHLDGDINNCHIDNLTFEEDVEEWRIIEYPETVKRNMYAVSSWGRVKNVKTGSIITQNRLSTRGYDATVYLVHRLVAYHFIQKLTDSTKQVNHIDGDKLNNHLSNLELVDHDQNMKHAYMTGLATSCGIRRQKLTSDEIRLIINMLADPKYRGRPRVIYENIDHFEHPNIAYHSICNIKYLMNKGHWQNAYDTTGIKLSEDFTFVKTRPGRETNITDDDLFVIVSELLNPTNNGEPYRVYKVIDHEKYPNITYRCICNIKRGHFKKDITRLFGREINFMNECRSKKPTIPKT